MIRKRRQAVIVEALKDFTRAELQEVIQRADFSNLAKKCAERELARREQDQKRLAPAQRERRPA